MVRNGVAANLLLMGIVVAGIISGYHLEQEVFPELSLDRIQVSVEYRGASPDEIEESIVQKLEEQLSAIEGVDEITSVANEGNANVILELALGQPMGKRLDEVKAEVDRITSFPDLAEEPQVRELTNLQRIMEIAVFGDTTEQAIKEAAYRIKDDLVALDSISYVEVGGIRDYEISVEVSQLQLRAYGITLEDVAGAIRANSLDLPSGDIDTSSEQLLLRTKGRNYVRSDFENIIVFGSRSGARIRLADIANIDDGFRDIDKITRFDGQQGAFVNVYRVGSERVLDIAEEVRHYMENASAGVLPEGVQTSLWRDSSEYMADRLNMLLRNAALGLALVLLCLTMMLDLRLALWVAVGIFVSFVGTLIIMGAAGVSINIVTLFGFILAIGIVVDDAIVTGENIFAEQEGGLSPVAAAIAGAQRIAAPVIFAVSTTVLAFMPLLAMPAMFGKITAGIPIIVISVLLFSLFESLLILPHHLSLLKARSLGADVKMSLFDRVHRRVNLLFQDFINGPLDRALRFVTGHYLITILAAVSLLMLGAGLLAGGILKLQFFPNVAGSNVSVDIELHDGATADATHSVINHIYDTGIRTAEAMQKEHGIEENIIRGASYTVGEIAGAGGPGGVAQGGSGSNVGQISFEMVDIESLPFGIEKFEYNWRDAVGNIADIKKISFSATSADFGAPIEVALSAPARADLNRAVDVVREELSSIQGVFDIEDDRSTGKREINFYLRPEARNYNLSLDELARQVRAAYFGAEALRVQRGREEVRVYVKLPENERNAISDLEDYRIRTNEGAFVPLSEVAELSFTNSPSSIKRRNSRRVVTILAEVDPSVVTGEEVSALLDKRILPALQEDISGLSYEFTGQGRDLELIKSHLLRNFGLAILAIYALLAVAFRSYFQPVVVLSVIPFGAIGALLGHLLLGKQFSMLSIFGLIGLSGVIINNSLVMVDFINSESRKGKPLRQAIIDGAKGRFRPILLTSLTTFVGVLPIVMEKSVQAQFVIPMALSLGFGVLFGTVILMLLVPALVMMPLSHPAVFSHEESEKAGEARIPFPP